jgi:DNA-binding HxlR family transcriptional regulator
VSARSYDQYCSVAQALDVVGERWSLLVVRELLEGPKRYVELQEGLVTISTDVLATRLRDLEQAGVVTHRGKVYQLTARGRDLEPVISALARWGVEELGRRRGRAFHPPWLARAVRAGIRDDRGGVDLVVRFVLPEGEFALHIDARSVDPVDVSAAADVVLTGKVEDLAALSVDPSGSADLVAAGRLGIEGKPRAVAQFAALFGDR